MALALKCSAGAIGASLTPQRAALQGNGGSRARTQAQIQLASNLQCSSSSRSGCGIVSQSNPRQWTDALVGDFCGKLAWSGQFSSPGSHLLLREPLQSQASIQIRRVGTSASLGGAPTTVRVAASLFQLGTALVVPFYTAMILAPKREWTKKMMESELTYFILGAGYIYLLCLSWTPETVGLMFSSKYWLPELSGITRMFASTITVASAWLHLLAVDLFAGRQIFLDGLTHNVETRHSLVLCLMMCPIGIFCHLVTKSVILFSRGTAKERVMEISNDLPPFRTLSPVNQSEIISK